jgi:hypothetical protein
MRMFKRKIIGKICYDGKIVTNIEWLFMTVICGRCVKCVSADACVNKCFAKNGNNNVSQLEINQITGYPHYYRAIFLFLFGLPLTTV